MSGLLAFRHLEVSLLPDISYPQLVVVSEYPFASPHEVEKSVTMPLEEAFRSLEQLRGIYSYSQEGASIIELHFQWGVNVDFALLHIREKMTSLRDILPREISRSYVLNYNPNTKPVVKMVLSGRGSLRELAQFASDVLKPQLEQLDGVAAVHVTGMPREELKIIVDPRKLMQFDITLEDVKTALEQNNPQQVLSGTVRDGNALFPIVVSRFLAEPQKFGEIVIKRTSSGLLFQLKDVAKILQTPRKAEAVTFYDNKQVLGMSFYKEAGANTLSATRRIHQQFEEIRKRYPDIHAVIVQDKGHFIRQSIESLAFSILLGAVLSFLILLLFLKRFKTALIIGITIPVSILAVFNLLYLQNISLNIMSLGGLALGVGLMVDNAIIVIEAIYRSLQEKDKDEVYLGVREVAQAIFGSTLTTISIFIPLFYVKGFASELFKTQALTITYALVASLIVALSLIPMLATAFFKKPKIESWRFSSEGLLPTPAVAGVLYRTGGRVLGALAVTRHLGAGLLRRGGNYFVQPLFRQFDRFYNAFEKGYHWVLSFCLSNRKITLLGFLVVGLLASQIFVQTKREYFPAIASRYATLDLEFSQEIAFPDLVQQIEQLIPSIQSMEEVSHLLVNMESASASGGSRHATGQSQIGVVSHRVEMNLALQYPMRDLTGLSNKLFKRLPSTTVARRFQPGETILEGALTREKKNLVLHVSGGNKVIMEEMTELLAARLQNFQDLRNIDIQVGGKQRVRRVKLNTSALKKYNLSPQDVAVFLSRRLKGFSVGEWYQVDRKIPVQLYVSGEDEKTLTEISESYFPRNGISIPVREIVIFDETEKAAQIFRANQKRVMIVSADVEGYKLPGLLPEVMEAARKTVNWAGYDVEISGESRQMAEAFAQLRFALLFAIVIVYMILAAQFESLLHPFNIILTVPMGLAGATFAIFLFQQSWNVLSLIGLVMLIGIGVNDAIVKVDYVNLLRRQWGYQKRAAVLKASKDKLRPVLMTSLTTVFALIPMAIGIGANSDLNRPLALTLIGGLIFTTLLTLILTPVLYEMFD